MLETDQSRGTAQQREVRHVLVAPRGNLRLGGRKNRGERLVRGFRGGGEGGRVHRGEFGVGGIERGGRRRNDGISRGDRRDGWIGGNSGNSGNRRRLGVGIGGEEGVEVIDKIGMTMEELANLEVREEKEGENTRSSTLEILKSLFAWLRRMEINSLYSLSPLSLKRS